MIKLTIFTPTYNRAYILNNLYKSLLKQSCTDFKWLIVDDGSTDETEKIVDKWMKECKLFPIIYLKQKNSGKQIAHNKGVSMCDTELFFCVDSDDSLTEDAVESVLKKWEEADENIAGIIALRGTSQDSPLGSRMPSVYTSTLMQLYQKWSFKGDTALIYRTDVLKKYPFILLEGERFIGENYVYDQIDQSYTMLLEDKVIYIGNYLEDGYTKSTVKLLVQNPKSYMLMKKQAARLSVSKVYKIKHMAGYIGMGLMIGEKNLVKRSGNPLLAVLSFPLGVLIWRKRFRGVDGNF